MSETRFTAAPTSSYERPSMVGTVLGNYRLISEISTGGMGTVYQAQHEILGRLAAVKLLRPDLDASQELIDRFFNEAKAASTIRHPGIVEIYDFGYSEAGNAYIVMELLEGTPLDQALADAERFPEQEAGSIARGIASALKAAHARGIIHRDLKPDNVFLVPDLEGTTGSMRPKVLDFGIAKLQRSPDQAHHTQIGALIGTPLYMAPEQAREASAIDHRADLYSLGCILYEMLVGKPPFMADGAGELLAMHLFATPESPRVAVPGLSQETEAIVLRLLAKEPDERFQSASDVANALSTVVGVRVSAELGIQRQTASSPAASRRLDAMSTLRQVDLSTEMRPPAPEAPKRTLPIIAGVATAVIALAVIVTLALRGGSENPSEEPASEPKRVEIEATPKPPVRETAPARELPRDAPAPAPVVSPAELDKPRKPTKPRAPITRPGQVDEKPTTPRKPQGPTTSEGSPIEIDLEPVKQKEASP